MRRIALTFKLKKPILACGADMKGAFALGIGAQIFLYEGFGDLGDPDNFVKYEKAIAGALRTARIKPAIVACDMHPGYFSTRFAEAYTLYAKRYVLYKVQHHEAHIASAIVDNAIKGDCIGAAFDGTGYGVDGNIWGGEFFVGGLKRFKRAAHLEYVPMPGADAAIREPWRMAASYLYTACGKGGKGKFLKSFSKRGQAPFIIKMIEKRINSPLTSSAGRLFDAAASLVLKKKTAGFEAELPIKFEKIADTDCAETYGAILPSAAAGIIKCVAADVGKKVNAGVISARFHNTVANLIALTVKKIGKRYSIKKIILSGGVFQNRYLSGKTKDILVRDGFSVYTHKNISTTDSGIPVGQIVIANARALCV